MDVLFVCAEAPTGERPRPHGIIAALARFGHAITLVFADQAGTTFDDLSPSCRRILPVRHERDLVAAVRSEVASGQFDLVHLDARTAARIGRPLTVPTVVDAVTCVSQRMEHTLRADGLLARIAHTLTLARTRRREAARLWPYHHVIVATEHDVGALSAIGVSKETGIHVYAVPSPVDLERFAPPMRLRDPATFLLDLRDLSRHEAGLALHLAARAMPAIWVVRADARLIVLGNVAQRHAGRIAADPRLVFAGAVHDPRGHLATATVALAPLASTTAAPQAALEALATGLPLVACSQIARDLAGTDGEHLLVADEPLALARIALALLNDAPYRGRLGRAGRRLVGREHSWERTAAALEDVYAAATGSALAEWRLEVGLHRPTRTDQDESRGEVRRDQAP